MDDKFFAVLASTFAAPSGPIFRAAERQVTFTYSLPDITLAGNAVLCCMFFVSETPTFPTFTEPETWTTISQASTLNGTMLLMGRTTLGDPVQTFVIDTGDTPTHVCFSEVGGLIDSYELIPQSAQTLLGGGEMPAATIPDPDSLNAYAVCFLASGAGASVPAADLLDWPAIQFDGTFFGNTIRAYNEPDIFNADKSQDGGGIGSDVIGCLTAVFYTQDSVPV